MKKKIVLIIMSVALFSMVFAENTFQSKKVGVKKNITTKKPAYLGVYTKPLSIDYSQRTNYPYNFGVIINGVVPKSPAEKQGLLPGDILMKIDRLKILNDEKFIELLEKYKEGDKSKFLIFRNGKEIEIDFVYGGRKKNYNVSSNTTMSSNKNSSKGHRINVGGGNFYWNPTWVKMNNLSDINDLLKGLQFNSIDDSGVLMKGFTAEGNVGKNIFLGFAGQWYKKQGSINVERTFYDENGAINANFKRDYSMNIKYLGFNLIKKIGISKHLISGLGLMIGSGTSTIMITEKYHDDNIDSPQIDWNNLNDEYSNAFSHENHLTIEQKNWIIHPKISLEYKILSWLGIKSEVGYLKGYSANGWETKLNGSKIELRNNPDSKMDGFTYSLGLTLGG